MPTKPLILLGGGGHCKSVIVLTNRVDISNSVR